MIASTSGVFPFESNDELTPDVPVLADYGGMHRLSVGCGALAPLRDQVRGAYMITTPGRQMTAPVMSQRSGWNLSTGMPQAREPATKMPSYAASITSEVRVGLLGWR